MSPIFSFQRMKTCSHGQHRATGNFYNVCREVSSVDLRWDEALEGIQTACLHLQHELNIEVQGQFSTNSSTKSWLTCIIPLKRPARYCGIRGLLCMCPLSHNVSMSSRYQMSTCFSFYLHENLWNIWGQAINRSGSISIISSLMSFWIFTSNKVHIFHKATVTQPWCDFFLHTCDSIRQLSLGYMNQNKKSTGDNLMLQTHFRPMEPWHYDGELSFMKCFKYIKYTLYITGFNQSIHFKLDPEFEDQRQIV